MNKLVSIIIPNYNCEKYIEECVLSVEKQNYKNIEVMIIDDGSTDNSINIIKKIEKKYSNVKAIFQNNFGAPCARNKGIETCKGEYILFLDSDDILFEESISSLVNNLEKNNSDIVIGNFIKINEKSNKIAYCRNEKIEKISDNKFDFISEIPNPSNKLYKSEIIKNNNIIFDNVRIGQDLNFYLKYIIFCKKVSTINNTIYGWRQVSGSISNSYNFKIFDIVESFNNIKKFYKRFNMNDNYNKYVSSLEFRHYYIQLEKIINFEDKKYKKLIYDYFKLHIDKINLNESKNFNLIKNEYKNYKIKTYFKIIYLSNIYKKLKKS